MHLQTIFALAIAAFASANPVPDSQTSSGVSAAQGLAANCNDSIGNCFSNGCEGNPTTLVCTSGDYRGCPCGFDCIGKGPCNGNGCEGRNGRCTANFLGCACSP